MKLNHISPQTIVAAYAVPALMAFSPALSAEEALYGSGAEQIVTFAFTEYYEEPNLKPKDDDGKPQNGNLVYENEYSTVKYDRAENLVEESDNFEYGSKQVAMKISNKEFLDELIDEEYIPGPIAGWAVTFVTPGEWPDSSEGGFYAVKNGHDPVNLSEIIYTDEDGFAGSESEKWSSKTNYKYTPNGDYSETWQESWSFSGKWMTNVEIEFSFLDGYAHLDGIFNESWSLKSFGKGENQYWQFVPGAAKFDSGTGSRHYEGQFEDESEEEWEEVSVLRGTISLSAGKLFPDINDPYPDFMYDSDDEE